MKTLDFLSSRVRPMVPILLAAVLAAGLSGAAPPRLSHKDLSPRIVAWSKDGRQIAFQSLEPVPGSEDDEETLYLVVVAAAGGSPVRLTQLGCLLTTDLLAPCSDKDDRAIRQGMSAETAWLKQSGFVAPGRLPPGVRVETVEGEGIGIFTGALKRVQRWPAEGPRLAAGKEVRDAALSPDGKTLAVLEFLATTSAISWQIVVGPWPDLKGPLPLAPAVDNDAGPPGPPAARPARLGVLKPGVIGWSHDSRLVAYLLHGQEGAGAKELLFAVHDVARDAPVKLLSLGWHRRSGPVDPQHTSSAAKSADDWLLRQGFVPAPPLPQGVRFSKSEAEQFSLHVPNKGVVENWPPHADLNVISWWSAASLSPHGRLLAFVGSCQFDPFEPNGNAFAARAASPGEHRLVVGEMP
jgi:hypothetical protein